MPRRAVEVRNGFAWLRLRVTDNLASRCRLKACVTQFGAGRKEVILKARGRAISHAVDVAEIVRKKFVKDVHGNAILTTADETLAALRIMAPDYTITAVKNS